MTRSGEEGDCEHSVDIALTVAEASYIAGVIDGDGSICIFYNGHEKGKIKYPAVRLVISNTNLGLLQWLQQRISGCIIPLKPTSSRLIYKSNLQRYNLTLNINAIRKIYPQISPFIVGKKAEFNILGKALAVIGTYDARNFAKAKELRRQLLSVRNRGNRIYE
jgi:hypothetical protein